MTTVAGNPILFTAAVVVVAMALIGVLGVVFTRFTRQISLWAGASKFVAYSADQWITVLMVVLAVAVFAGLTGISAKFI